MDIQTIITGIIVGVSALLAIRFLAKKFMPKKKDDGSNCEDTSACKGCPVAKSCSNEDKQ